MLKSIFYFLNSIGLLLFLTSTAVSQENINPKKLTGNWYGDFVLASGNGQHQMLLSITDYDKKAKELKGTILWPDYHYSKTSFTGELKEQELIITEDHLLQGALMEMGNFSFSLNTDGQLTGKDLKHGHTLILKKEKEFSKEELATIQKYVAEQKEYFGEIIIEQEEIDINTDELLAPRSQTTYTDDDFYMIDGAMGVENMKLPFKTTFSGAGKYMYMEVELMGAKMLQVQNEKEKWSYNPLNKKLEVNPIEEGDDTDDEFSNIHFGSDEIRQKLAEGYRITSVRNAMVHGTPTYRLLFEHEEDAPFTFFFDKKSKLPYRKVLEGESTMYYDYQQLEADFAPTRMVMLGQQKMTLSFTQFKKIELSDYSLFEVPKSLEQEKAQRPTPSHKDLNAQGNALITEGKTEEAITYYNRAIQLKPNNWVYLDNRAGAKLQNGDLYGALVDIEKALELNPNYLNAINHRGVIKHKMGDIDAAIKDFELAAEVDSTAAQPLANLAYIHMQKQDFQKACDVMKTLVQHHDSVGMYHRDYGITLAQVKEYEKAIVQYDIAAEMEGENATIYNYRGISYYQLEQYEQAYENFLAAHKLNPKDITMLTNVGQLQQELEKYGEAVKSFKKILKLEENNEKAQFELARSYHFNGDFDKAMKAYNELMDLNSQNAYYYDARAYLKKDMDLKKEAIEDFTTSIALYDEDAETYYQRGLLHVEVFNNHKACLDFERALELKHPEAEKMLEEHCKM
ncbi:tetratricopeptide repeat protein [Algivirga pacifica]|uniref:Tetratricopeptide repeat-containing protein n=1 Tax=Algivirga pacifica TaxID=1162670 RepID=A0ABP9DFI4_9BACT